MKQIFSILFLFLLFCCSKYEEQNKIEPEIINLNYIKEKRADTLKERNYIAVFEKTTEKKTNLSESELKIVNENLIQSIDDYNNKLRKKIEKRNKEDKSLTWDYEKEKLNLRYYYRQYFVSINKNGDKIVNVFCFCSYRDDNWREYGIQVSDGGDCYLNAEINITKNKIKYFQTHGLA